MTQNYDSSQVGVLYERAHRIVIEYPDQGRPAQATIHRSLAVKLADGTVRKIEDLSPIIRSFNLTIDGTTKIPMVHPETGAPLGVSTDLNTVMLNILAVVRREQLAEYAE